MSDNFLQLNLQNQRTLAAIVFTDAVSFSARMSENEEHTLALIKRDIQLMTNICNQFHGQVLKSTGDGLLMYFASATNAVACAIEIQKMLAGSANKLPPEDILTHRIGIHLGDVFVSDNDVMGNGVNIAARLQTEAEPGGICISHTVYEVVKNSLSLKAVCLGAKELKNISEAIQIYRVLLASETSVNSEITQKKNEPRTHHELRNRKILLNKVRNYWIKGVLETSLHDKILIELGIEERSDVVKRPWGLLWENSGTSRQPIANSRVSDKFEELGEGRTLLILGEPGSGKTTTLLELAKELIAKSEKDSNLPVPVIFNLSSWNSCRPGIADWLIYELYTQYQVSKEIGKTWLEEQQLLLLLDGLDEVKGEQQDACITELNRFISKYGQTEIVVCCRMGDYERLSNQLKMQSAIYLKPLTQAQIQDYLANFGESLAILSNSLAGDPILQEFAKSPLMLNIMTIAYQDISADALPAQNTEELRKHLFDTYIERMFKRKGSESPNKEQTKRWLAWLAKQMSQESQTIFLIERLQPQCLETKHQKRMYSLGIGIICGLILGFSGGIYVGLGYGISGGLTSGFWLGLGGTLIGSLLLVKVLNRIEPVESIKWSWESVKKNIRLGIWVGLSVGILYAISVECIYHILELPVGWDVVFVLIVKNGVGVFLIFVLLRGLSGSGIETQTSPNYGIIQSLKNAIILILIGAISLGIIAKIIDFHIYSGIIIGVLFGIFSPAGVACLQHIVLRAVLSITGEIPLNYAKFLDYCVRLIFLQKVGGGYIFIHRLLLEHFAYKSGFSKFSENTSYFGGAESISQTEVSR